MKILSKSSNENQRGSRRVGLSGHSRYFPSAEPTVIKGVIGSGSFGMVYSAKLYDSNENVAIKKVYQDKRFKNRELQIMRRLEHPNIVRLMYYYYAAENSNEEYLYLVLEFFPKTLHQVIKAFAQTGHVLDLFTVKVRS
ncbi:hypothetical protein Y032_0316g2279 [Ancylostoma ceylanicum]|uniref:Protein kinase domain-containing protein n=1 Tax=Ancylostoma ceylanicum TaxID=53326 RepID=A0A016S1P0_9BILA|nr:hypothetical protein Y032_0316g2279 [Ancylostoma ceylanicum]